MDEPGIFFEEIPKLRKPVLIAGFDGWGNAMEAAKGTVDYIIARLGGKPFAGLIPDMFYRFDETRPLIEVENGVLKSIMPPGGNFYAIRNESGENDLVVLSANEPGIRWFKFVDDLLDFCDRLGVLSVITVGSMYDSVLHSERIISGMASDEDLMAELKQLNILPITYNGGGAVHALIQSEGENMGFSCCSIWCHCPFYLDQTVHFGMMSALVSILATLAGFQPNTEELEGKWLKANENIRKLIDENPNLQAVVSEIREERGEGMRKSGEEKETGSKKIIDLMDFMEPK